MTDAPERIWIAPWREGDWSEGDWDDNEGKTLNDKPCIEYVRADRIEQLAVTNEALTAELTLMTTERDEAWKRAAHSEKMWGEAEVKLAKAVEALEFYTGYDDDGSIARATLAEISSEAALNKGESHE